MTVDESIIDIDLNYLEFEAARQPKLYYQISKELADKKAELDEVERGLSLLHADLAKRVRSNPGKYGLDEKKLTETGIKSVVMTIKKYTDRLAVESKLKYEIDLLKGVLNALEHKKRMIEQEVTLHGQNYFSTPYVKDERWKEGVDKAVKKKIRKKGVKRKRKTR